MEGILQVFPGEISKAINGTVSEEIEVRFCELVLNFPKNVRKNLKETMNFPK